MPSWWTIWIGLLVSPLAFCVVLTLGLAALLFVIGGAPLPFLTNQLIALFGFHYALSLTIGLFFVWLLRRLGLLKPLPTFAVGSVVSLFLLLLIATIYFYRLGQMPAFDWERNAVFAIFTAATISPVAVFSLWLRWNLKRSDDA